jgi:hypothetical protein
MDRGYKWMWQNGTVLTEKNLGRIDRYYKGGTVFVQTDSEDMVGKQRTVIRGCTRLNQLIELNLYVDVLTNNYPDFVSTINTTWTLEVNQTERYPLPRLVDKEGNDQPEVYITKFNDLEYPPFLFFENYTNTLIFRPDSIYYSGKSYYFTIVVKEKNSDTVMYPYFCAVKINGTVIDPMEFI